MKKIIKIPIAIVGSIIAIIVFMFIFSICPPQGPWPMPPWCVYKNVQPYQYEELSYITDTFEKTNKNLEFGIGMMDIWGNPHIWLDLGEDTTKNVDTTMKRLNDIGSEDLLITDYVLLKDDGSILFPTKDQIPGNYNMLQSELEDLVKKARENSQEKIMMVINLMDTSDEIRGYLEESQKAGKIKELIIAKYINSTTAKKGLLSSKEILDDFTKDDWDKMFEQWKEVMIIEAKKAEKAGIDYLIINPRDVGFEGYFWNDKTYIDQKYQDLVKELRKHYSGKLGMYGIVQYIGELNVTNDLDFIVIDWDSHWCPYVNECFDNTPEDLSAIEDSWECYFNKVFNKESCKVFESKETYLLVTMPSYDGAMKEGWIEPGGVYPDMKVDFKEQALVYEALFRTLYKNEYPITGVISYGYWWTDSLYPETRALRNDLSHSIRQKDAEHVFCKWAHIFV